MGILNVRALKDWMALKAVNHMLATEEGYYLDARLGPVIQKELDALKANVGEINSNLGKEYTAESEDVSCTNGNSTITSARLVLPAGVYVLTASVYWDNGTDAISGYRRIFLTRGDFYNSETIVANDAAGCRSWQRQSCSGVFTSTGNVIRIFLLQSNTAGASITASDIKLRAVRIK